MIPGRREAAVHQAGRVQQMPLAIIAPKQRTGRNAQTCQHGRPGRRLRPGWRVPPGAVFVAAVSEPRQRRSTRRREREDGGHQGHQDEDPDALGQHDARQVGGTGGSQHDHRGKGARHRGAARGHPVPAVEPFEVDRAGEQRGHDRQGKQGEAAGPSLHLRHALRRGARAHGDAEQHEGDVAQARRQANRQVRHRRCDDGHHRASEPRCRQAKRREQRTAGGGDRHGQQQPANRAKIGASACCWWAHRRTCPKVDARQSSCARLPPLFPFGARRSSPSPSACHLRQGSTRASWPVLRDPSVDGDGRRSSACERCRSWLAPCPARRCRPRHSLDRGRPARPC